MNLLDNGHKTMEPNAAFGFTWIVDAKDLTWADCRMIARLTGVMEEGGSVDGSKKETFISVVSFILNFCTFMDDRR